MTWIWVRQNYLTLINLVGSVSSIVGFSVLLISMASSHSHKNPEIVVWQYIFFFMSIIFIAASAVFTIFWIADGLATSSRSRAMTVLFVTPKLFAGVILMGIGFDGLISAIYWTIWFGEWLHALGIS